MELLLPSRNIKFAGFLVSLFSLFCLCYATWSEANTTVADAPTSDHGSIPLPGVGWLEQAALAGHKFVWEGKVYPSVYNVIVGEEPLSVPCRNMNAFINSYFVPRGFTESIINSMGVELGHTIISYIRNFIAASMVYYAAAAIFHYFCYIHPMSKKIFADRERPTSDVMWHQIKLAQSSMFIYSMLPVLDEFMIEQGWTRVYFTMEEIGGWFNCLTNFLLYFTLVEIGIYWVHRTLHTNKFLYKYVHLPHHQYKKPETLTPWASLAFHPLDGILQASPYVVSLFVFPVHYLTHLVLLFNSGVWATYIHDSMDFNIDPIMGSKFHTVHHTHYIYNYGQMFIFCDWFWGTLRIPVEKTGSKTQKLKKL